MDWLEAEEAAEAAEASKNSEPEFVTINGGDSGPLDRLAETAEWEDILIHGAQWETAEPQDRETLKAFKRPGGTYDISAKVLKANPHVLVVHSDAAGLPSGKGQKLTKGRVYAHLWHNGDESAAAIAMLKGEAHHLPTHIREALKVDRPSDRLRGLYNGLRPTAGSQDRQQDKPPADSINEADVAEFWDARPALQHIRDFARARRVGPWALLGCVMVRVIAATPPNLKLPALVGGQAGLNLYAGIVSVSGGGKGTAESCSTRRNRPPPYSGSGPRKRRRHRPPVLRMGQDRQGTQAAHHSGHLVGSRNRHTLRAQRQTGIHPVTRAPQSLDG
jgi:hypothetical protein